MRLQYFTLLLAVVSLNLPVSGGLAANEAGDPQKGQRLFKTCAACHSLTPGRHMTGPSLAAIWGRKAGTVDGFTRYSKALKQADIVWDEHSLDGLLKNPREFVPGNRMTFRGVANEAQTQDLIAYLRSVSVEGTPAPNQQADGKSEGMMRQRKILNLKTLEANNRITSIGYCGDTYMVVVKTGDVYDFWEFNLRFKSDGSEYGPLKDNPVIIPASMRGDRAFVIFASPAEISPFIQKGC